MKKILAIDDIRENLLLIKNWLKRYIPDCEVITTQSGREGIRIAHKEQPDTILLDINMPIMDGYQVCEALKQDHSTQHIPIVFITAHDRNSENVIKGLNMGADAFITKPVDPAELATQVKVMLRIKDAEDNLKKEVEKYRVMTETLQDAVTTFNLNEEIVYISPQTKELFGFDKSTRLIGQNVVELLLKNHEKTFRQTLIDVLDQEITQRIELNFKRFDENEFTGDLRVSIIKDNQGFPCEFIMVIKDISEQKETENEILAYQKQLKSLNSSLTKAEEKERKLIAGYLHDGIGQTLSLARMKLTSLSKVELPEKTKKKLSDSSDLINDAITKTRSLTYDLSPPILYELGLIPAIRWKLNLIKEKSGIDTSFKSNKDIPQIDNDARILLYRTISELLTNCIKHAECDFISVEVDKDSNHLYIAVVDNGKGFCYKPENDGDQMSGFGLFSIKERLESLQASLEINSKTNMGTRAIITFPVSQEVTYDN